MMISQQTCSYMQVTEREEPFNMLKLEVKNVNTMHAAIHEALREEQVEDVQVSMVPFILAVGWPSFLICSATRVVRKWPQCDGQ
jgi:hypothetical protein